MNWGIAPVCTGIPSHNFMIFLFKNYCEILCIVHVQEGQGDIVNTPATIHISECASCVTILLCVVCLCIQCRLCKLQC